MVRTRNRNEFHLRRQRRKLIGPTEWVSVALHDESRLCRPQQLFWASRPQQRVREDEHCKYSPVAVPCPSTMAPRGVPSAGYQSSRAVPTGVGTNRSSITTLAYLLPPSLDHGKSSGVDNLPMRTEGVDPFATCHAGAAVGDEVVQRMSVVGDL